MDRQKSYLWKVISGDVSLFSYFPLDGRISNHKIGLVLKSQIF